MALWSAFKGLFGSRNALNEEALSSNLSPACDKDTLAVIGALSRAAMQDPGAVEIYLALGNIYRSQGDIERALQIRESLLARTELAPGLKGRTWFEMGEDYRRAGLIDRAISAYHTSGRYGVGAQKISAALASIYADSGDYPQAVRHFAKIGNKPAEAHFMVREARDFILRGGSPEEAMRMLKKALKVFPALPEGWQTMIAILAFEGRWKQAAATLRGALEKIPAEKTFLLFEGLMQLTPAQNKGEEAAEKNAEFFNEMARAFLPVLDDKNQEILPHYYMAELLARSGRAEEAEAALAKALVLDPDFWSARLLMLELCLRRDAPSAVLAGQLEYFVGRARHVKKYHCGHCGLLREQLFYCCPRCHSWHSAALRKHL